MSVMTAQYENTSYKQIIPQAGQPVHTGPGSVQGQGQLNLMSIQTQCAVSPEIGIADSRDIRPVIRTDGGDTVPIVPRL